MKKSRRSGGALGIFVSAQPTYYLRFGLEPVKDQSDGLIAACASNTTGRTRTTQTQRTTARFRRRLWKHSPTVANPAEHGTPVLSWAMKRRISVSTRGQSGQMLPPTANGRFCADVRRQQPQPSRASIPLRRLQSLPMSRDGNPHVLRKIRIDGGR